MTTGPANTGTQESPVLRRVRSVVEPIAADLGLEVYDVEQRGGTIRVTLDTPPGSPGSVDLDQLALATRLVSRQLDHDDPVPGSYTLEVTSPGVERALRTPAHFRREVGKTVSVRLSDTTSDQRRFEGVLVAADDTTATFRIFGGDDVSDRTVPLASIDRARTVFEWGPTPKPGGKGVKRPKAAGARTSNDQRPGVTASPHTSDQPSEEAS
ncbi:MAG: ribosome maturation factor RimP [Actinomycetota bacterium]